MKITQLLTENDQTSAAHKEAVVLDGLYRGIRTTVDSDQIMKLPIRQNRRPRDASVESTVLFNVAFEQAHGERAIRARAAFCSTDISLTTHYAEASSYKDTSRGGGTVLHVYPLKTAKLAYHPDVDDSWQVMDQLDRQFRDIPLFAAVPTGDLSNSVEIYNQAVSQLSDQHKAAAEAAMKNCVAYMSRYKIVGAEQLSMVPEEVEVMMFNADYYYGKAAQVEEYDPYD